MGQIHFDLVLSERKDGASRLTSRADRELDPSRAQQRAGEEPPAAGFRFPSLLFPLTRLDYFSPSPLPWLDFGPSEGGSGLD